MSGPFRTALGGRVDRAQDDRLHLRRAALSGPRGRHARHARCSPTASICWAARSNITARAARSRWARTSRTRWSRVDAGKGRVTPNLRATQVELYEGLNARSQNAWPSLQFDALAVNGALSPLFPAGFYYKTFMRPLGAWEAIYEPVDPPRRRPRRRAERARSRSLRLRASPLRSRRRRRRPGGSRGGAGRGAGRRARHPVRRAARIRRLAAGGNARLDRRQERRRLGRGGGRRTRGLAERHAAAAHAGLRLLRRRISSPPQQRLTDHLALSRSAAAARAALAGAGQARDPRDRRARAPAGVPRQRPAGHHARRFRAHARRALRRASRGARSSSPTSHDGGYRAALDLADAGCEIAMIADSRAEATGPLAGGGAQGAGCAVETACGDPGLARRPARDPRAGRAALVGRAAGQAERHRLRRDRDERRLDAERASVLAIARQAGVRRGDADASCRARRRRRRPASAPAAACSIWPRRWPKARGPARRPRAGRGRGAARRGRAGLARAARSASSRRWRTSSFRRPSSISRTTSPRATSGSRRARACARSSTSSATPRPAWRPIRARPRT